MNFNEPVLLNESKAVALEYPEDLLWAAYPRYLHNANESDVFTYLWAEITDPRTSRGFVRRGLQICLVI